VARRFIAWNRPFSAGFRATIFDKALPEGLAYIRPVASKTTPGNEKRMG
jgi:hypothetical protein